MGWGSKGWRGAWRAAGADGLGVGVKARSRRRGAAVMVPAALGAALVASVASVGSIAWPARAGAQQPPAKTPPAAKTKKEASPLEQARRGVAVVERGGQPIALGAVLARDGRVLTALSPLGAGNGLEVRFADGSSARVKVGHHDRVWDLALLVPQTGRWAHGLVASPADPLAKGEAPHALTLRAGKPVLVPIDLRSRKTLLGADDVPLEDALEVGSRVSPQDLGAPILDGSGRVLGLLARGCAPNEGKPCTPVAFGAPMPAIRSFLKGVPASAQPPAPWLGIQGVSDPAGVARGVRVVQVHPEGPADEASLKAGGPGKGDVILAVAGVPVTSPESLAEALRSHAPGEKVELLVLGQGKYRTVTVLLGAAQSAAQPAPASKPPPDSPKPPPKSPKKGARPAELPKRL